ncbi:MAG: glycosyltransferase family 4 protein [Deltaproteobacteria bacterium]|nr:glycosyltransferase family 4 protein [Deltaproteobacteria bacterium]
MAPRTIHRVLMTTDTMGGVWTYALELSEALGAYGVQVMLASMGEPLDKCQWDAVRKIPNLEIFESGFKLEWMQDPWADVDLAGDWLLELEALTAPDIVHLNGYSHAVLPWQSPKLVVGHSSVYAWFEAVKGSEPPAAWKTYHSRISAGLSAADLVTAPTFTELASLRRHYGSFRTAGPIYNGRKSSLFPPRPKESFILTVGRLWDEAKNIPALEAIAADLPWPVYGAGENCHPEGGRRRPRGIHYLGKLTPAEVAHWFSRAAVYVLPARYEPFGLSALEAGLAGCALVLSGIPSLREIWGDAATYVAPGCPEALRKAVEELIYDHERRSLMAERAKDRALRFTPPRMAESYLKTYALMQHRKTATKEWGKRLLARNRPSFSGSFI